MDTLTISMVTQLNAHAFHVMAQRRGAGFYTETEIDSVLKYVLEDERQNVDDELDVENGQQPEGFYKVERAVERRVRKVKGEVIAYYN